MSSSLGNYWRLFNHNFCTLLVLNESLIWINRLFINQRKVLRAHNSLIHLLLVTNPFDSFRKHRLLVAHIKT